MAITHYIDTSLPEIARSRVKSLTNRVTEAFPVLVYGDTRNHNFVFHNAGTVESFSGGAGYSLRVTLGAVQMGPTKGSYVLTCGSSVTVDALSDASTIQAALNGLTTIISDGGVVVTGTFPNFLVTWNTVGVKTAFTVDASLCIPQTGISLVTTQTGSASVVNQVAIVLRQAAISSQSTWTVISSPAAGWTGTITTNSAGALLLLNVLGQAVGNFIEANTVLTAEVLDSNSVPISYYQTPIILRAKNLDPSASVTPPLTTYTLGDMLYGNASGTLTRLAGNTTTTPKVLMQTGTGAVSAAPVWSTASTLIDGVGSTQGSLIYRGASAWAALTPGSAGAMLLSGGAGANPAWSTDLTYSTPTLSVPDAFNISSAGSITLTAGGTNKDITFTPSGTGRVIVPNGSATLPGLSFVGLVGNTGLYWTGPGVLGFSSAGTASLYFNSGGIVSGTSSNSLTLAADGSIALTAGGSNKGVTLRSTGTAAVTLSNATVIPSAPAGFGFQLGSYGLIDNIGDGAYLAFRRTNTSAASPSAIQSGNTIGYIPFQGYKATAYSGDTASIAVKAPATWTDSSAPTDIYFGTTNSGAASKSDRMVLHSWGQLELGLIGATTPAWGSSGVLLKVAGLTWTDSSSSGTVATAVANSFNTSVFAASSATTFTNAANVYIAGDVVNGTNVTLTNSYGLWNAGKTRLDKPVVHTPSALTYASPTSVDVTLASVYTVTTVNATGSVTFNATAGGTAGQSMTIIITNDATSAKTITFGTNFLANGTLTPSGVGKIATIQFISNGTNFCEVSRTILP